MSNRGPSQMAGGIQWGPDRYPVIWVYENNSDMDEGRYFAFPLHRLTAFAAGELDHPRFKDEDVTVIEERGPVPDDVEDLNEQFDAWTEPDGREAHHQDYDIWNADARNIEAMGSEKHGEETARAMADGGEV